VVLWLFIGLKPLIWPIPVAFGSRCVEEPIFLCGRCVVEMVKGIKYLDVEAQQKRGRDNQFTCPAQFTIYSPEERF